MCKPAADKVRATCEVCREVHTVRLSGGQAFCQHCKKATRHKEGRHKKIKVG